MYTINNYELFKPRNIKEIHQVSPYPTKQLHNLSINLQYAAVTETSKHSTKKMFRSIPQSFVRYQYFTDYTLVKED